MPGFATSELTLRNARALMQALGVSAHEIDIRPSATQMLARHRPPGRRGRARLRHHLRERAGGRAHLAPVPPGQPPRRAGARHRRPLRAGARLEHLRRRRPDVALQRQRLGAEDADPVPDPLGDRHATSSARPPARCCSSVLDTEISPELVPADDPDADKPGQSSESVVGPYELQDFFLYYIAALRLPAEQGRVPRPPRLGRPRARRLAGPDPAPSAATSTRWPRSSTGSRSSCERFFQTSQFKRSAIPNAPKVGSGGSLSPRGDWRAPSDSTADAWLAELREAVPDT